MDQTHKQSLLKLIMPQIDALNPGDYAECEGLFHPDIWLMLDDGERISMGHQVAQLEKAREIPLVRDGFTSARHNRYRRI